MTLIFPWRGAFAVFDLLFSDVILRKLSDTEIILESQSRRAVEQLSTESRDLLVAYIRMPEVDSIELLRIIHYRTFSPRPGPETRASTPAIGSSGSLLSMAIFLKLGKSFPIFGNRLHIFFALFFFLVF